MRKKKLQGNGAMSETAYVDQAATWAKRLTQTEARGPGDMENAWHRLEARYGVSWRTFWALRYRKPREITAFLFDQLKAAHSAELERQMRLYQHEAEISKAIAGPRAALVRTAAALAGKDGE